MTWDSSQTVVVIKQLLTSALTLTVSYSDTASLLTCSVCISKLQSTQWLCLLFFLCQALVFAKSLVLDLPSSRAAPGKKCIIVNSTACYRHTLWGTYMGACCIHLIAGSGGLLECQRDTSCTRVYPVLSFLGCSCCCTTVSLQFG